jgi:hypothetical protein
MPAVTTKPRCLAEYILIFSPTLYDQICRNSTMISILDYIQGQIFQRNGSALQESGDIKRSFEANRLCHLEIGCKSRGMIIHFEWAKGKDQVIHT